MPGSTLNDALLPPRSRLLYIGPMKTGTTAIQAAARDQRQTLLDHGACYPGTKLNHRSALGALLGWSTVTASDRPMPARFRRAYDQAVKQLRSGEVFGLVVTPDGTRGEHTH